METSLADMGMPLVDRPRRWPMKIFHAKCQPRANARLPVRTTLRAPAMPPMVRLRSPMSHWQAFLKVFFVHAVFIDFNLVGKAMLSLS